MVKQLILVMVVIIVVILAVFFYAGIYMPVEEAPQLVEEVDGVGVRSMPEEDVVLFTFQRNNPVEFQKIFLEGEGMKDPEQMEKELDKQEYVAILRQLWSEKDGEKRLQWLRAIAGKGHPPLLFELALEEVKKNPTVTGVEEAIFLLELGKVRTELDALCVTDSSAGAAADTLYATYAKAVAKVVASNPLLVKELVEAAGSTLSKKVNDRLANAYVDMRSRLGALPPPNWVAGHSLQKLFLNREIVVTPADCRKRQEVLLDTYILEKRSTKPLSTQRRSSPRHQGS